MLVLAGRSGMVINTHHPKQMSHMAGDVRQPTMIAQGHGKGFRFA
jgi:hypothetical protein